MEVILKQALAIEQSKRISSPGEFTRMMNSLNASYKTKQPIIYQAHQGVGEGQQVKGKFNKQQKPDTIPEQDSIGNNSSKPMNIPY